jgi:hypothetical protein
VYLIKDYFSHLLLLKWLIKLNDCDKNYIKNSKNVNSGISEFHSNNYFQKKKLLNFTRFFREFEILWKTVFWL